MSSKFQKIAFLFPGQGAQYTGMGKDWYDQFSICKDTFDEADDILHRKLSKIIFEGNEKELTETKNSQTGIFVMSVAIYRYLQSTYPQFQPSYVSGLSLGEYSALFASNKISFQDVLPLVQKRGELMNEACNRTEGTMAVILGLTPQSVIEMVHALNLPDDLWVANFNCPGQVVISGTLKGIELGSIRAKELGAKRVMNLPVHGAFHSGLMLYAKNLLEPYIESAPLKESSIDIVMNVTGDVEKNLTAIRKNLSLQVTSSVKWEMGINQLQKEGVDLYIEMGPGKTLAGMNKKIGVLSSTLSLEKVSDLQQLEALL